MPPADDRDAGHLRLRRRRNRRHRLRERVSVAAGGGLAGGALDAEAIAALGARRAAGR